METIEYDQMLNGVLEKASNDELEVLHAVIMKKKITETLSIHDGYRIRVDGATFCLRDGRVLTCYP